MSYAQEQALATSIGERADAEIADLTARIATAQSDLEQARASLLAATADDVADDATIAGLRDSLATAQAALTKAQADLAAAKGQINTATQTIAQRDALIASLRTQLAAATPAPQVPFKVNSLEAYLATGRGPRDATGALLKADAKTPAGDPLFTFWRDDVANDLESQARAAKPGQIIVLPERSEPYWIDTDDGFTAVGVDYIEDTYTTPTRTNLSTKWKGQAVRTWFAMTRIRRGLLGLGPGAVVDTRPSAFRRPQQSPNSNTTMSYHYAPNNTMTKIVGNQEKLIEVDERTSGPYFGNFTMRATADLGGVAYHGIVANGIRGTTPQPAIFENLDLDNCWRGHSYSPNGETGALGVGGPHVIRDSTIRAANVGKTSLVMSNWVDAGSIIERLVVTDPNGGLVRWQCAGKQTFRDVVLPVGSNLNIEDNQAGFDLTILGGMIGGIPGTGYDINLRSPNGSTKLTLRGVKKGPDRPVFTFNVWAAGSEPRTQRAEDINVFDADGTPLQVRVAGSLAGTSGTTGQTVTRMSTGVAPPLA